MERLTIEYCDGYAPKELCDIGESGKADDCEICGEYCEAIKSCQECAINQCFKKLAQYENLEEQGLLPKLPCKVGDTVYFVSERNEKQGRRKVTIEFVEKGIVDNITLGSTMIPQVTVCTAENMWTTFDGVEDFGKIIFLTQNEAEEALKGMEGDGEG